MENDLPIKCKVIKGLIEQIIVEDWRENTFLQIINGKKRDKKEVK